MNQCHGEADLPRSSMLSSLNERVVSESLPVEAREAAGLRPEVVFIMVGIPSTKGVCGFVWC